MAGGRVLLIANNFPPVRGGSALVYSELARHANGMVEVLAPRTHYADDLPLIGWREHDRQAPFRVTRLMLLRTPLRKSGNDPPIARLRFIAYDLALRLALIGRLVAILATRPISAVCIGELMSGAWILRVLRFWPGLRRVVYVHGEEITTDDNYDPSGRRRRAALAAADVIIVVSRFTFDTVASMLPGARDRIRLIENGVDFDRFAPAPGGPRGDLIERHGLRGHFVFVSVCRLLEKKGIDNAIRAFATLHRTDPDLRFLVVGDGPYAATLAQIAVAEGVSEAVVFAGDVPDADLTDHYRLGDVFVMPNRALASGDTEGFGLVFLEANAAGLPVIAGRDGGSPAAVRDGENGLLVDGHSVPAIAAAMRRLREDDALRARLAEGGRSRASRSDWRMKAAEFIAACHDDTAP
jgi:phosphatidylinositol alpha-1,6-mannosyltransferase